MSVRVFLALVASTLAWQVVPTLAAEQEVHVVRRGQGLIVSRGEQVAAKLVALAESASVNSTAYAVAGDTWAKVLASDSFVHVSFHKPRTLRLEAPTGQARQPYQVRSLLLPLPTGQWPVHLLVEADGKTISLTKFNPLALKQLVSESELQLSAVEPYSSLIGIRSAR